MKPPANCCCVPARKKMLPGNVVKDMLDEKVEALEAEQGQALKKKEKEALKERILMTLLPRAFTRHSQTFLWINPADGYVAVDAGSVKKADDALALLREHRLAACSAVGTEESAGDHHDRMAQRHHAASRFHPGGCLNRSCWC